MPRSRCAPQGVDPAAIESIELGVPSPVLRTIAEPPEDKARPKSGYHAAFCGPYTVAAALLGGGGLGLGHDDFTDAAAADGPGWRWPRRSRCVADARCDEIFPHQFPAVLRVRMRDGNGTRCGSTTTGAGRATRSARRSWPRSSLSTPPQCRTATRSPQPCSTLRPRRTWPV